MKKILSLILLSVLLLTLAACGAKEPVTNGANGAIAPQTPKQSQIDSNTQKPISVAPGSKTLPANYPRETLPLAADAEIIDVRENPASKGLEVSYVSDNNIGTLRDFYEAALKDAKDLNTDEMPDGYWITAKIDGVDYTVMISKNAMNPTKYAGKISVYLILSGLEGIAGLIEKPVGEGEAWPAAELPGVPELKGHISKILREDGIIRLELTVESAAEVKNYIGELTKAGFSFDTEPDAASNHMEFLAFKDGSMVSFAYKGAENAVSIEYQK